MNDFTLENYSWNRIEIEYLKVQTTQIEKSFISKCYRQLLSDLVQVNGDVHFVKKYLNKQATWKLIFWFTPVKNHFFALIVTSDVIQLAISNIIRRINIIFKELTRNDFVIKFSSTFFCKPSYEVQTWGISLARLNLK